MRIEVIRQIHLCLLFKCLSNPAAYVKITTLIAHEFLIPTVPTSHDMGFVAYFATYVLLMAEVVL